MWKFTSLILCNINIIFLLPGKLKINIIISYLHVMKIFNPCDLNINMHLCKNKYSCGLEVNMFLCKVFVHIM